MYICVCMDEIDMIVDSKTIRKGCCNFCVKGSCVLGVLREMEFAIFLLCMLCI